MRIAAGGVAGGGGGVAGRQAGNIPKEEVGPKMGRYFLTKVTNEREGKVQKKSQITMTSLTVGGLTLIFSSSRNTALSQKENEDEDEERRRRKKEEENLKMKIENLKKKKKLIIRHFFLCWPLLHFFGEVQTPRLAKSIF